MPQQLKIDEQSFIQKWVAWMAGAVLLAAFGFYSFNFPGGLSASQGTWGEFGDFVGGAINPIIGFFTILLLSISLRQNHKALAQTHEELALTRVAVEDARKMQAATEAALKDQTAIAANAKDMNNAISLYRELDRQYMGMAEGIEQDNQLLLNSAEYMVKRKDYLRLIEIQRIMLGAVLSIETHRLIQAYCPEEMRKKYEGEISELLRAK